MYPDLGLHPDVVEMIHVDCNVVNVFHVHLAIFPVALVVDLHVIRVVSNVPAPQLDQHQDPLAAPLEHSTILAQLKRETLMILMIVVVGEDYVKRSREVEDVVVESHSLQMDMDQISIYHLVIILMRIR